MYKHETDVHNTSAAKEVVPYLIKEFNPQSVLDVGCGIGTWLSIFKENGLTDIIGIDGNYVNTNLLYQFIDDSEFVPHDLTKAFDLKRKFDLAITLEVAEHLPNTSADAFVSSICNHAEIVIFSAAIPNQWGQNHINEQWQSYWVDLFASKGYQCYDILRPIFWDNKNVEWWYKQNMLVFSSKHFGKLNKPQSIIDIIHKEHFNQKVNRIADLERKVNDLEIELDFIKNGKQGVFSGLTVFKKSLLNKFKT